MSSNVLARPVFSTAVAILKAGDGRLIEQRDLASDLCVFLQVGVTELSGS